MKGYATTLDRIQEAAQNLLGKARLTPVLVDTILNEETDPKLFFKAESLQEIGAFKIRGATHALACLTAHERRQGVVTHSSGNHAQAVAFAARALNVPAHIVMPTNAPEIKRRAVASYGAQIYDCAPTLDARQETAAALASKHQLTMIHPYDDPRVISGQGTVGLEIAQQVPDATAVVIPIGGGGLCAGSTIALKALRPDIKIYGAEPTGADDAFRSFRSGVWTPQTEPDTIADGLRTSMGQLTWPIIRDHLEDVLTVTDEQIAVAMKKMWERLRLIVEPSGAVGLAAVYAHANQFTREDKVVIVITGGNVDLNKLPW